MYDLSLHILDIVENSINGGATLIKIYIDENLEKDLLTLVIEDNGRGIKKEDIKKVLDPFYTTRTTRKVGLGLSLLSQSVQMSGGTIMVDSEIGKGTTVTATFKHSNIDRKPLGDIVQTFITLIAGHPEIDFSYCHKKEGKAVCYDTREIKNVLEDVPIDTIDVLKFIKEKLYEELKEIKVNFS